MDISAHNAGNSTTVLSVGFVDNIQIGDQRAEAEFVDAYLGGLISMLLNRTKYPDVVRDCCQEVFLITLEKIRAGGVLKPQSIKAFLIRTAANVVVTHYRTESRYTNL